MSTPTPEKTTWERLRDGPFDLIGGLILMLIFATAVPYVLMAAPFVILAYVIIKSVRKVLPETTKQKEQRLAEEKRQKLAEEQRQKEAEFLRAAEELAAGERRAEAQRQAAAIAARNRSISRSINALRNLSPDAFESHIADMYKRLGYEVKQTKRTGDGGFDATIKRQREYFVIECKRYAEHNLVGRPLLQKFASAIIDNRARHGIFITTSSFTQIAVDYVKTRRDVDITLVDWQNLLKLMNESYSATSAFAPPDLIADVDPEFDIYAAPINRDLWRDDVRNRRIVVSK